MPETKSEYLKTHNRDICPGCGYWVFWCHNKEGKRVFGCQIGLIPHNGECRARKGKRSREVPTVI